MRHVLIGAALAAAASLASAPSRAQRPDFDCTAVQEHLSCAQGAGALAGRIIGIALSCSVPAERWTPVAERMAAIVADLAVDEEDRLEGMRLMNAVGQEALRRRASGEDTSPGVGFIRNFGDLARRFGVD